jgi:hypothetical protein
MEDHWITLTGKIIPISKMHTVHIKNTIALIHSCVHQRDYTYLPQVPTYRDAVEWLERLEDELQRRTDQEEKWMKEQNEIFKKLKFLAKLKNNY